MTHWFSLHRRLLGLLMGGISVAWALTMTLSYLDAHHEIDELFDAQLAHSAQTLLALATQNDYDKRIGDLSTVGVAGHPYQRRLFFQIWHRDGRLAMRSENAPEQPLTTQAGFSEAPALPSATMDASLWRLYSQWNRDGTLQVQVAEDHAIRDELTGNIAWRLLLPALLGLPLIALGAWLATRQGLSTLDGMATQLEGRQPDQLQALAPSSAPVEIRPMLDALNNLFGRVAATLDAERRFTADAAHELRTPLAALAAQAHVALQARDEAERTQALGQMQIGLERAAHLVEQMLLLARLDPASRLPDPEMLDLVELVETVCAEQGNAILARQLDFDFSSEAGCLVWGQRAWLSVLVRNLIDNAIRYTPTGGQLRVAVRHHLGQLRLEVGDSGPGIPASERAQVLERFHRLHNGSIPGSGLGLAIVDRITRLHGARLSLDTAVQGGLLAVVTWPPAASESA